jgi:uncharacterized protein YcbK (DUF882 family)
MRSDTFFNMLIGRRGFFKIGVQTALCSLFPVTAIASIDYCLMPKRNLSLFNMHTGEKLDVCYYAKGKYRAEALKKINHIFRDFRTGEIKTIRKELLNLLYSISREIDQQTPLHIISGYRSPETNAELRRKSKNVAKNSLHIQGEAADIRVPEYDTRRLRKLCMKLKVGGVGYYPSSDFVHVDIGPVRYW